tara:strand:- start:18 stop:761 length:744 start_codon:yes stop_codon:yes gene_type:complete
MENNSSNLPLLNIISLINSPFFININRDDILTRSFNDIGNTSHPTDEKFTESLEKIKFTEDQEELSCGICLEEFKKGDEAFILPCKDQKHYFHVGNNKDTCEGILPWLKNNNTCPICREKFPEKEEDEISTPISDTDLNDNNGETTDENINDEDSLIPIPEINFDVINPENIDTTDSESDNDENTNDENDENININNIDSFLENILTTYLNNNNTNLRPRIQIINTYENDEEDLEFQQAIQRSLQER